MNIFLMIQHEFDKNTRQLWTESENWKQNEKHFFLQNIIKCHYDSGFGKQKEEFFKFTLNLPLRVKPITTHDSNF